MNLTVKQKRVVYCLVGSMSIFIVWFIFCLPSVLFENPYSVVILDRKGSLLGARIAEDGQWRFPHDSIVPDKFVKSLIAFEDKRFYDHHGVDFLSAGRAFKQNISSLRKVSGASTITMQLIRLSRNQPRTIFEKIIESMMALRLEISYDKKEILALYASHAPFGGNVVGLNAASWRYYGKSQKDLSWGEAATLAVLPNSPSLIHPGKNEHLLMAKRNRLLKKMQELNVIDSITCSLAMLERLPGKPLKLPSHTPHLLTKISKDLKEKNSRGEVVTTSIDFNIQHQLNSILLRHHLMLSANGVYNLAALVISVKTGEVLGYAGNVYTESNYYHNCDVDNCISRRSTGSILKPLLYASMIEEGQILPDMLIPDIPTFINRYSPKNFNSTFDGAVPASKALARSLNIPAVHMLQSYTPAKFTHKLKQFGLTTLDRSADHYGLSLILGGAEAKLWDLASVYAGMARTLSFYNKAGSYRKHEFEYPHYYLKQKREDTVTLKNPPVISAASVWLTFDAMLKVSRPDEEKYWTNYTSSRKVAWKTGTSFGNRDAWSIGCTPEFVVAVWVGNSNGDGRPGLTGISSAAPVLFDIFNMLPSPGDWFAKPEKDMQVVTVCSKSGYLASGICPETNDVMIKKNKTGSGVCPYHHLVHLDRERKFRVHGDCEETENMLHEAWFILPPSMEKYYKEQHPDYREVPIVRKDCLRGTSSFFKRGSMEMIYPQNPTKIYLPKDLEGKTGSTVFEVTHRNLSASIYWHLDDKYLGETKTGLHQRAMAPSIGKHKLTLVDDAGEMLVQYFEIVK